MRAVSRGHSEVSASQLGQYSSEPNSYEIELDPYSLSRYLASDVVHSEPMVT